MKHLFESRVAHNPGLGSLRAGDGIWLYQFLIIAYLFTLGGVIDVASAIISHEQTQ